MSTSVGIITTHRVHNCGSFLQAYALQVVIKRLGCRSEYIDYAPKSEGQTINRYDVPVRFCNIMHFLIRDIWHRRWNLAKNDLKLLRWDWMLRTKLNLTCKTYTTLDDLTAFCPEYDRYMVGSDQVWNERFMQNDSAYMLSFAPEGRKKISYASSVANIHWTNKFEECVREFLSTFYKISCREKINACLLGEVLKKKVVAVLDPVMLLEPKEWSQLLGIEDSKSDERGYILFLLYNYMHDIHQLALSVLDEAIRENPKLVVWSNRYISGRDSHIVEMDTPPSFVKIIRNADLVISDSFHAVAFSLLFNVPVMRVDAKSDTDVRIEDLCQRVATQDGKVYTLDKEKFEAERTFSYTFLREALRITNVESK